MYRRTITCLLALAIGCSSALAQQIPKPYDNWPVTDTEWNKLTNHIMWCFNSLRDRRFVATRETLNTNDWTPTLICPFKDYLRIAKEIDDLSPCFVRQELAGSGGDFASYLAPTGGDCPQVFPRWNPETLHSKAFGRAGWSTNTALTAWMAVTNRAIVAEVTAAIHLLKWTVEDDFVITDAWPAYQGKYAEVLAITSFDSAVGLLRSRYADANAFSCVGYQYNLYAHNGLSVYGIGLDVIHKYGYGALFNSGRIFDFSVCDVGGIRPEVSAYFGRNITTNGYSPSGIGARQRMFFGETLGVAQDGVSLVTSLNPFYGITAGLFPLEYAGLNTVSCNNASYSENGYINWLLKWNFGGDNPALPDSAPVQMPDTDRDDIVEVVPVRGVPGAETGTFVVTHEDDDPSLYIPLSEPLPWELEVPMHAYLTQSSAAPLPYHFTSFSNNDPYGRYVRNDGHTTAFSLNTRIEDVGIFSNGSVHVKQALVIRPRGQAVIFDFPWEGTKFSMTGYPTGVNRNLGYVLWDLSGDCDFRGGYCVLQFPSGIGHRLSWQSETPLTIGSVYKDNGKYGVSFFSHDSPENWACGPTVATNGRYCVSIGWDKGLPVSAQYRSTVSGELCESVEIQYQNGRAVKLVKSDAAAGAEIDSNGRVLYGAGSACSRQQTGSRENGRTVTVMTFKNAGDSAPFFAEEREYDAKTRLTRRMTSSGQLLPFASHFTYQSEAVTDERYPMTGLLVRNLASASVSDTSFGSYSETYAYTPDEGWLARVTKDLGGNKTSVSLYSYSDPLDDLWNYVLYGPQRRKCLDSITRQQDGDAYQKSLFFFDSNNSIEQICSDLGSVFDDVENITYYNYSTGFGLRTISATPSSNYCAEYTYLGCDYDCSHTQLTMRASVNWGSRTNMVIISSRGIPLYNRTESNEGAVLEETRTEVDGRGRPTFQHFMDGTMVSYMDYCLHGPQKIVNRDGSTTALNYDSLGRVKKRVDGETGITFEYEYDPLGNVPHLTQSGNGSKAEMFATYGMDGALTYSKDENGHEVWITGRNVDGYREMTRKETGKGDVVETYWADGILKSVSGDGAVAKFDRERGVTNSMLWIKEANPSNAAEWTMEWYAFNGLYAYTERPGGAINSVAYDERLNVKSTVSGDGVKGVFSNDAYHFNLPVVSGMPLTGNELNLSTDPYCSSNAYAFTTQGLKSTQYTFSEDGSSTPREACYMQVTPDGLSGTFAVEGRPGSFSCDAQPSKGTYTMTVNLPGGGTAIYTFRKFLLRETTTRAAALSSKIWKTYDYDWLGRLISYRTNERGFTETVTVRRDALGLIGSVNSTSRGTTTLVRNGFGQVMQVDDPSGVTTLDWLDCGILKSCSRDAGPEYARKLDPLGRDSSTTRTYGGITSTLGLSYGIDGGFAGKTRDGAPTLSVTSRRADGRPISTTLSDGVTVTRSFDAVGRVSGELWADPMNPYRNVAYTFSWMRDGSLRTHAQSGGQLVSNSVSCIPVRVETSDFDCPGINRATVQTVYGGANGETSTVQGQFTGVANGAFGSGALYDGLGRVHSVTGSGFTVSLACIDGGWVTNTSVSAGGTVLTRAVTWSAKAGKPVRVDYALGGQFLRRWQYAFTKGHVASVTRSGGDGVRTDYTYDGAGQLLSASSYLTNASGSWQSFSGLSYGFGYAAGGDTTAFGHRDMPRYSTASNDLQGTRTWEGAVPYLSVLGRVSASNATIKVAYRASTNTANVLGCLYFSVLGLITSNPLACTSGVATVIATLGGTSETAAVAFALPASSETPIYNGRGMILADSRRRYVWDAAGRLTAVTNSGVSPAVLLKFAYYPDGRRAMKSVLGLANGVWTTSRSLQYAWDGWKLAGECERDGAGTVTAVRSFVWGPDIVGQQTASLESGAEGIGGLLLIREWTPSGERMYLPLTDGLGNVCGLIDASDGSLAAEYDYDPYGGPVVERGVAANACPFRHRTRYYDPETWLYYYGYRYYDPSTTKWISKDPLGEAGGWNLTAFCGNDPVNQYDALGLDFNDGTSPSGLSYYYGRGNIFEEMFLYNGWNNFVDCMNLGEAGLQKTMGVLRNANMDFIVPQPQDFLAGSAMIQRSLFDDSLSSADRIELTGLGLFTGLMGMMDVVDIIPDPTDVLQKRARDLGNGFLRKGESSSRYVHSTLPELRGTFAEAFDGPARLRTFKAGERIYRTPNWIGDVLESADRPGPWLSTRLLKTKAGVESQLNVLKWGNPLEEMRVYEFTEDVTVYYGKIMGGRGYQTLIPRDVKPADVLRFIEGEILK